MGPKGPDKTGQGSTLEDEFDQLLDALGKDDPMSGKSGVDPAPQPPSAAAQDASPAAEANDADPDDDRVTPVMDEDDRQTPIMPVPSQPPAPILESRTADSKSATRPAPEGDFKRLFALSNPSSAPPNVDPVVREVAEVVSGKHPSLRASPLPRMYVPAADDPFSPSVDVPLDDLADSVPPPDRAPEIEITGEAELSAEDLGEQQSPDPEPEPKELSLDDITKIVDQCLFLYREMDMDFSSVYSHALQFKVQPKKRNRYDPEETYMSHHEVTSVIHYFLQTFTSALSRHLLDGKTNVVQTNVGMLAHRLFHKIARFGAGEVICDPITVEQFRLIKKLLEAVPSAKGQMLEVAEDFVGSLDTKVIR